MMYIKSENRADEFRVEGFGTHKFIAAINTQKVVTRFA